MNHFIIMTGLQVCQFYFSIICTYDIIVWLTFRKGGLALPDLILASRSPRRLELLRGLGFSFRAESFDVDETCDLPAPEAVELLSLRKARAAQAKYAGSYILSADTLVSFRNDTLGKPKDQNDACRMLRLLSGNTHQVYTGVTVLSPDGQAFTDHDCSNVTFCDLSDRDIHSYVSSGEPMDKAGSYAIQGRAALWISHMDGSPSSVIGLSLYLVRSLLLQSGFPLDRMLDSMQ